jgi:hypothetical protein
MCTDTLGLVFSFIDEITMYTILYPLYRTKNQELLGILISRFGRYYRVTKDIKLEHLIMESRMSKFLSNHLMVHFENRNPGIYKYIFDRLGTHDNTYLTLVTGEIGRFINH